MDARKAIEEHIKECEHRIEVIKIFMETNDESDKAQCSENIKRFETIISLLKKHIPIKPILTDKQLIRYVNVYRCPTCMGSFSSVIPGHCYHCGQAFDWSVDEEREVEE